MSQRLIVLDEPDYNQLVESNSLFAPSKDPGTWKEGVGEQVNKLEPIEDGTPEEAKETKEETKETKEETKEEETKEGTKAEETKEGTKEETKETKEETREETKEKKVEQTHLEQVLSRLPLTSRKSALNLLSRLCETNKFSVEPTTELIFVSDRQLPGKYCLGQLLADTCVPFTRPSFPPRLRTFLQRQGIISFRNHRADIRPKWENKFNFPASTMGTRWAPFVAQRLSATKRKHKA